MKLQRSESTSKPSKVKEKRKRALKRQPRYRDFQEDDVKYLWAAEKMSGDTTDPEVFKEETLRALEQQYDYAWTVEAKTSKGYRPIGIILGLWAGPFTLVGDMTWFPWATPREIFEGVLNMAHKGKKDYLFMGYAAEKDKKFFVKLAQHGVIRRIGTVHGVYEYEPVALFQTR